MVSQSLGYGKTLSLGEECTMAIFFFMKVSSQGNMSVRFTEQYEGVSVKGS